MARASFIYESMKNRFSYKELTLLLGIVVAAIILLIIWSQPEANEASEAGKQATPQLNLPAVKILLKQAIVYLQSFR